MNSTLNIYKASAGSGKTFTLTVEYIYLMVRPQADEEYMHTLAVTFTNKAAAEMKKRIRRILPDRDLGRITTFHGFCVGLLKTYSSWIA